MAGTTDDLKGRAKEAAGDLTGDKDLQREGKLDRAAGTVKDKVSDAKEWIEDKVDGAKDRASKDCPSGSQFASGRRPSAGDGDRLASGPVRPGPVRPVRRPAGCGPSRPQRPGAQPGSGGTGRGAAGPV